VDWCREGWSEGGKEGGVWSPHASPETPSDKNERFNGLTEFYTHIPGADTCYHYPYHAGVDDAHYDDDGGHGRQQQQRWDFF